MYLLSSVIFKYFISFSGFFVMPENVNTILNRSAEKASLPLLFKDSLVCYSFTEHLVNPLLWNPSLLSLHFQGEL